MSCTSQPTTAGCQLVMPDPVVKCMQGYRVMPISNRRARTHGPPRSRGRVDFFSVAGTISEGRFRYSRRNSMPSSLRNLRQHIHIQISNRIECNATVHWKSASPLADCQKCSYALRG